MSLVKIEFFKIKVFDTLTAKDENVLVVGIGAIPNMRYYAGRNLN